ncbi:MAG: efflux RND transporter periplasmic adaptor subunit [Lachnospiraceae bacterium]|nr:efflux RND transporter periplasmic adaptor subunit [Lachnospiraceae bacterium]
MKKIWEFIKKHKKLFIILAIVLAIVIVIAVLVHRTKKKAEEMLGMMTQETYVLEKRNLVQSVSGSGKIASIEKKDIVLASLANTKVATMDVKVGDTVKEGDIICTFDTEEIERNLANAKTDLAISQKKTANQMENQTRSLYNTRVDAVNDTNRNLEELDKAQRIYDTEQGEKAEASRIYDKVEDVYEDYWDEDAYYYYLGELAAVRKELESDPTDADLLEKEREYSDKIANLETAKSKMAAAKGDTDSATKSVDSAADSLTDAKRKQEDNFRKDVSGALDAENNYENAQLDASVASRDFEDKVRKYEEQLEDATLRAPFAGIITAINFEAGDTYSGQALLTIEDLSSYVIEAGIDEYDISKVAVGQQVRFKTNATGDEELEAEVVQIAPRATTAAASSSTGSSTTAGTASYQVKMKITSDTKDLRLDMTAKINIIIDQADNVYAVPFSAVQTDENGNKYIEVQEEAANAAMTVPADGDVPAAESEAAAGGEVPAAEAGSGIPDVASMPKGAGALPTRRIPVTVGVETDYYIEINSPELYDGMVVVVPSTDSNLDNMMMFMGPAGGL